MDRPWNTSEDAIDLDTIAGCYTGGYTGGFTRTFAAREVAYLDRVAWDRNTPDFLGDDYPRDISEAEAVEIYDPAGDVAEALRAAAPLSESDEGGPVPEPPSTYEDLVYAYGHTNPTERWGIRFCDRIGMDAAWALFDLETWALKAQTFNEHVISEIEASVLP